MIVINFGFALVNVLFKKALDEGTNEMVIVAYRLAVSTIFLTPIAYYRERKSRTKLTGTVLSYLFVGALIGLTLCQYLFLLGLKYTSAGFSCAFLNTVPVNTFLLAIPFGLEKVKLGSKSGRAKVLGAVICMSGAILLTVYKGAPLTNFHGGTFSPNSSVSEEKSRKWVLGSILLIGGCLSWSSWFLIQAQVMKRYPCPYSSTTILTLFASVQTTVLSLIIKRDASMWILKGKWEILTVVYSGVVGSGLCYVGMSWCVKRKGPVFTAAFTPFTQIFAAVFDFSFLHEQLFLGSIIGSVFVILGLYILLWGKSKEAAEKCVIEDVVIKEAVVEVHDDPPEVQVVKPATT
ncbi:WAT1-related protein At3g30340 [Linum grandiflorum]